MEYLQILWLRGGGVVGRVSADFVVAGGGVIGGVFADLVVARR